MVTNPVLDLNTEKHTTDNDISLNEEANRERHVYGSSNSGEGKVEPKVSHVNDFQNGVGVESMQVTLNALHGNVGSDYVEERKEEEVIDLDCRGLRLVDCKKEEDVKEDRANETECEANTGDLLEVHCEKEDVMEDKGNETECEANTGDLLEVHCEKEDVMEDKGNEAECEANICNLLEVHCEKEDDVMEHEAVCVANIGNSLEVHCEKEDDVMEDEASEAECEADVGNSLEKEPQNVQDQDPLELQFKNESKKKRSSLNDLGCNEMDYQEVDLNCTRGNTVKELESSTSMDLMTYESHEKGLIREGSTALVFGGMDGLDEKEMDYQHVHFVSHQENTAKNFSLESTGEEDEHVMDQKIHTPDDRVAMDVDHCDNEMMLMQSEKEEDVMKTLPIEVACEGKLGNLPENKEKEFHKVGFVADMHNACSDEYDDGSKVLDFCAGQVEVWMARLKDAARRKVQSDSEINRKLLEKLEEQSQTIQRYETMRQKEQQQKQKDVRKYERELYLMKNVLQDYKKALKAVHNSFARYRERCQLPDESVYMDHPSGGGRLILVAKWKKLEQKRVIKAMVKKFEQDWVGKLEGHLENFDSFCDKLEDLEFAVRKLKEKAEATGYGTQKASHV